MKRKSRIKRIKIKNNKNKVISTEKKQQNEQILKYVHSAVKQKEVEVIIKNEPILL